MSATLGIALACLAFCSCFACYWLGIEQEREKNRRREFNDDNFED